MTSNEKVLLSCLSILQLNHRFKPYVKNNFFTSNDAKKTWERLCKLHEKGVDPNITELDKPPKGAEHIAQDLLARFIITEEIESKVTHLNSPDLLSLNVTGALAREGYKDRRVTKDEKNPKADMTTGVPQLDSILEGWYKKELCLVAAPPFGGKTHWLVYFGATAVRKKLKVVHIFREDTPRRMAQYYRQAKVALNDLLLLDYSDQAPVLKEIEDIATEEKPDVFIVDYADLLQDSGETDVERFKIRELYQGLRNIANKTNCVMLTASQTDATGDGLAEAKVIKKAICDVVLYYKDNYLKIDKARGRDLKRNSLFVVPNWDDFSIKERKGI
jgi:hypothetical protein